jgi:hypothetical protein
VKGLFVAVAFALVTVGCASQVPPHLSPQAVAAWKGTKVIHAIDAIRDLAQDGASTSPPLISVSTATAITAWHKAALVTIHEAPYGWPQMVDVGLTQLAATLPPKEKQQLGPYLALAQTVLKEVLK